MTSRDYTQEIGLPSHKKTLPRPVAFAILAVVAVGVSFGVVSVVKATKEHEEAEKKHSAPASATAPTSSAVPPAK